jgi:3-oxoacyl-[acyl-carrier-protein] synthase-1
MLMLETEAHAKTRGARILAIINAIGTGDEPEAFVSEKASTGKGLTAAINGALAKKSADYQLENIYCDFNGESYYAFELGLIMSRLGKRLVPTHGINHPADCYGDVGSASGGLLIACAIDNFIKNPKISQDALIWTANDSGKRTALLLESTSAQG